MDYVSPILCCVFEGVKWARKHIGYATHVKSQIRNLEKEMGNLERVYADVGRMVDTARVRFQPVKEQVDGWQSRVETFKAKVYVDIQLPLNCSCTGHCPNCWTRYQLGRKVVTEHKEDVAKLINEGKEYSNGTVVDPTLPSPIEKNINIIQEEAKRLWDLEADINSKVEVTKRESLLLPKRQIEGWIKRVSEHKKDVSAIQNDFEGMEKSDHHQKLLWVQLSHRAENMLKETEKLISEGRFFEDVADPSRPVPLFEQAEVRTFGQDKEVYPRVLDLIKNEKVRRIGIHGMGGVGKTTLLRRINNYFKGSDHFDLIIWVNVSKDFIIAEIQQKIMKRCGMKDQNNTPLNQMEGKIRDFLTGKRYVLLLDDIWEPLDLSILGVPTGDSEVKSKILISSRSEGVCDKMQAIKVPINCLNTKEAWELFRTKVGEAILASDPRIEELAKQICKHCACLPLALEVIGTAMSEKYSFWEWSNANYTLEKHAPGFEDSEVKLFSCLKLSYDSLKNDITKECFCYCALFRKGREIDLLDLVTCWIGEGLFDDECDNIDAARDKGYTIIRDLIKAGLLKEVVDDEVNEILANLNEQQTVEMHDVICDMALWIKKDEFKINKEKFGVGEISGTETRLGLITTFGEDDSTERQRKQLAQFGKSAPNLSTLITTGEGVTLFTDDMLEAMNKLRVLHVYGWYLHGIPSSIERLKELRCLNLSDATLASIEMLAELGSLRQLIMALPSNKDKLSFKGVISRLSKLRALILTNKYFSDRVESLGVSISELESLPCLEDLQLSINTTSFLKGLACSPKLARCVSHLEILDMDISCFRLIQEVGSMDRLKHVHIIDGSPETEMFEVVIEEEQGGAKLKPNTLTNLTLLHFSGLDRLKKLRVCVEPKNSLQYLKFIYINSCNGLRFAYMGWPLPRLEVLVVECDQLEEIFKISGGSGIVFSKLRLIFARECPMLKRFCSDAFCFPSLQILKVTDCKRLKRLPRGVIQARKEALREIRGEQKWWDALKWDSKEDKMSLLPSFKSHGNIGDDLEEDNIGDDHSEEDNIGDDSEEDNIGDDHSDEDI